MNKRTDLLTNEKMEAIRAAVAKALEPLKEEFGLSTLEMGRITYDPARTYFNSSLSCKLNPELNERSKKIIEERNERESKTLGFNQNIVGEVVLSRDRGELVIVRLELNRPKYPIVTKAANGAHFKHQSTGLRFKNTSIVNHNDMRKVS